MQCNYLEVLSAGINPDKCIAGPGYYKTTEEDRSKYCIGEKFSDCPRFIASLKIMEAEGGINSSDG
ncbi:hypothetical protein [Methanosarcina horonobensis]|uniref:hypothetical protein n=1 Tax=Methanosarcina horonobensis TaxID=418008 RepID=UPI00064F0F8E|nr:hypothetical protein [Methanosarcina horonobensis]